MYEPNVKSNKRRAQCLSTIALHLYANPDTSTQTIVQEKKANIDNKLQLQQISLMITSHELKKDNETLYTYFHQIHQQLKIVSTI